MASEKNVSGIQTGNIWRIQFPPAAELVGPVDGIPDITGTRMLCVGLALLSAGFAIWLPIACAACAERMQSDSGPGLLLLVGLGSLVSAMLALLLFRAAWSAGGWCSVTATHLAFGLGRSRVEVGTGVDTQIRWEDVTTHPSSNFDVSLDSPNRYNILAPSIILWCRTENGSAERRLIPLSLTDDRLRCLRFRNRLQVQVAMLQMLAQQGLRFDPWVFAAASIDPVTWQPQVGPKMALWLASFAVIAVILGWTWMTVGRPSPGGMVTGAVLIFAIGTWIVKRLLDAAYPNLRRAIVFCSETGLTGVRLGNRCK